MPIGTRRPWLYSAVVVVEDEEGVPPTYSASEIGDVGYTTIEVTFNEDISSPTSDYLTGVTIKVNSISQTINSGTRQSNHAVVYYVIDTAVDVNDNITWEYDADLGDIESEDDNTPLEDVTAQVSTNYVGSHLYFDTEDDAVWVGAV